MVLQGDRARPLPPAPPEPGGGVEPRRIELGEHPRARPGETAQDGIDKTGEGMEATPAGERHRSRHRRVGGRVEEKEGRRTEPQDMLHAGGRGAAEMRLEHRIEGAEITEHGGGEPVGGGAIARGEEGKVGKGRIQGAAFIENRGEEMEGGLTGGIGGSGRRGDGTGGCGHGALSWLSRSGVTRGKRAPAPLMGRLASALRRAPRLTLLLFALACWLPGFSSIPPSDRDESRFVQATRQMLESGDVVRIMNGEEPRNRKPIGIYWLQLPFAAAARRLHLARANPVWPYRLPSLLGALLAVLATRRLGALLFSEETGLWAGLWLAASLLLAFEARIAKTDATLLGATTTALALLAGALFAPAGFRLRHALLFWATLGAGILIKGPITPLVLLFPLAWGFWQARAQRPWRRLRPGLGLPLLLLIVLPWFVAIGIATHGAFFTQAVGGDLGRKLTGGDDAHGAPFGTYLALAFVTFFPASLLLVPALASAARRFKTPAFSFLFAWLLPSWLIFELVPTKLPHYVLPLYPALALLTAVWFTGGEPPPARLAAIARGIFLLALAVIGAGLAALAVVSDFPSPRTGLGLLALLPLGGLGFFVVRCPDLRALSRLSLAAAPLLYLAAFGIELPRLEGLWVTVRLAADLRIAGPGRPFGAAGYAEPSLRFLAGTPTRFFATGAEAADFLAAHPDAVVAIERADEPDFTAEAQALGLALRRLGKESGFNYSKGRRVTLTLYEAEAGAGASAPARREVK